MTTGRMITETTVKAKVVIPLKSRIAVLWMLIVGGIFVAICLGLAAYLGVTVLVTHEQDEFGLAFTFIFGLGAVAIFIFYLLPGLLVLRGGRRGWIIASVILSLTTLGSLVWGLPLLLFFLIPLILILSDHISYKRGGDSNENHMS